MINQQTNFQCIDAIKVSLSIEEAGSAFYKKAAKKVENPRVQKMFKHLAEGEKEHIKALREKARFLQPLLPKKSENIDCTTAKKLSDDVFPASESFDFKSDFEAIDLGIESEKRTIKVLTLLMGAEKKIDVRVIFMHLIVEEKRHLLDLQNLRKSLLSS